MDKKNQKGITLIVLIITVIILLILAGVSIGILNDRDIIGKGKDAVNKANNQIIADSEQEEQIYVDYNNEIGKPIKGGTGDGKLHPGDKAKRTAKYEDEKGDIAVIPGGFTISGVETENTIEDGLVIYLIPADETVDWTDDEEVETAKQTYDQFVWIPVPDINEMYMCQSEDGTKSCRITVKKVDGEDVAYCTTHNSTLMAGRLYATSIGGNFNEGLTTQTYTANSGLREPDVVTGNSSGTGTSYDGSSTCRGYLNNILGTTENPTPFSNTADFKSYLQSEYNSIVKSVYLNEGFYVGRYETSNMIENKSNYMAPTKVVAGITEGISPINWYYAYVEQVDYANKKNLTTIESTMIQGAAYDQVMKFIDAPSYKIKPTISGEYNVAHNFSNKYYTGSQSTDFSKNIYDMEGNVFVWTTEASDNYVRIFRRRLLQR